VSGFEIATDTSTFVSIREGEILVAGHGTFGAGYNLAAKGTGGLTKR